MENSNIIIGSIVIIGTYFFISLWHNIRVNAKPDSCEICDSKRKIRIRRGVFIRMLPFASRREFCRNCRSKYVILIVFKKKIIVFFKEKVPLGKHLKRK